MSDTLKIPFMPVQGKEELIKKVDAMAGHIYYTTDTRKTYLGTASGEKLLMGYDTGIFFGTKEIPKDDSGNTPDPEVYFNIAEIEGSRLPVINDLILNVDGCFYRVEAILNTDNVKTKRLTLQGSGGGGGGGSTGPDVGYSWSMSFPGGTQVAYSTEIEKLELTFETAYMGDVDNYIIQADLYWGEYLNLDEELPFYTVSTSVDGDAIKLGTVDTIDISDCKSLFVETNKTVTLALTDKYGVRHSAALKIRLVKLMLSARENQLIAVSAKSPFQFSCKLDGVASGVSEKKVVYTFYKSGEDKSALTITNTLKQSNYTGDVDVILDISTLEHGSYKMTVQAFAKVVGMSTAIPSNIITHQIGYVREEVNAPILLTLAPSRTEQYTDIDIEYLYVTDNTQTNYTLEIRIDNIFYKNLVIKANEPGSCPFYFEESGQKRITFTVMQTGTSSTEILNLIAYSGELPIIDRERLDLMLYLNPKGKTNNDMDRNVWINSKVGSNLQGELTNVNYSQMDGWLVDETTGESYLKLISGATFTIPEFKPFNSELVYGEDTQSRVKGVTIELDFEVDGVLDATQPIISCISKTASGLPSAGFEITGSQIKLYNNRLNGVTVDPKIKAALTNQTVTEGQRIKISMVIEPNKGDKELPFPMAYTYLNGKLTEAVILDRNDHFVDTNTPARLKIDSQYAQVKIYGIRFYSNALSEQDILRNYTASLPTLEDRQKEFDSNNVYKGTEISFDLVTAEDYNLEIPYMILTGGYPSARDANKKCLWTVAEGEPRLPTDKKDYRFVDIEVVYPKTPLFADYQNYSYKNEFENGKWLDENIGNRAINGGAVMYCQGTSSMEYPVKNLRLRWKKKDNFFTVKPDLSPVEIICMKADYMESSGSHNTGAANLIDDIYSNAGMQTPGQKYGWDNGAGAWKDKRIVTCIKGHPCLIFYSETGETGTYKYIGKYNLNLDKATPEPFGFLHDEETNFGYLKDEEGNVVLDGEGNKQNSIFCYEFLDNAAYPVCNFLITSLPDKDGNIPVTYEDTWYKTFYHEKDDTYYPGWRMGFESRYPEDDKSTHGADAFYPLANWINELYTLRISGETEKEKTVNNKLAIERFANEYWKYLDKDFTLAYYIITEALLMVDSRVKNMMIATWGKEWRYRLADGTITDIKPSKGQKVDGVPTGNDYNAHFGYIFYPIFYDMDTMLGVSNEGRLKFQYYNEDTEPEIYNGANVLWHLVRDSLPTDLSTTFSRLEGSKLHAPNIIPYFNNNQSNLANEAFYNGDAAYKYVAPAREGYQDELNDQWIEAGAAPYLYALQGDRALHREAFINDRMRYLRGKYSSAKFLAGDQVAFRWYTPSEEDADPNVAQSAKDVPANTIFTFTGLKTGYAGIQLGSAGTPAIRRFTPKSVDTIELKGSLSISATEAYLLGVSTLSDLGDLSNKYMGKFVITSPNNRLERVQLGNPHKNYYNANWGSGSEHIVVSSPTLKEFNLQNCATYNRSINFENNPVIDTILMTGSGVTSVTFPDNGVIKELRLPNTITTFKINGHQQLTKDKFSMGTYKYGIDKGLDPEVREHSLIGGAGGEYVNDFSKIQYLEVINTPIDTYAIVDGNTDLISYNLQNIDWLITEKKDQYCRRNADWTYIDIETGDEVKLGDKVPSGYYQLINGSYIPYEEEVFPFEEYYLYEPIAMTEIRGEGDDEKEWITCIPMLERLLTLNTGGDDKPHNEAFSGTITIAVPNTNVVELEIYNKYKDIYPNIIIEYDNTVVNVEEAYKINFYPGSTDNEFVESVNGIENLLPSHSTLTATEAYTLTELIGSYVPVKIPETSKIFVFTGMWADWADESESKQIYYQDIGFEGETITIPKDAINFNDYKPQKDMDLVPIFESRIRKYQITLYDDDKTLLATAEIPYGSDIGEFFEMGIEEHPEYSHAIYNYKPYTNVNKPDCRWGFKGWKTNLTDIQLIHYLKGQKVTGDLAFYASYKEENVYQTPSMINSKDDFFNYNENYNINGITGAQISLKDEYRYLLCGKITLPKTSPSGKQIISIGDFNTKHSINQTYASTNFTHIYFEDSDNCSYLEVAENAFNTYYDNNTLPDIESALKVVELPASIQIINHNAFKTNFNLQQVKLNNQITTIGMSAFWGDSQLTNFGIDGLPEAIKSIGGSAFFQVGEGLWVESLPVGLQSLEAWVFATCPNVNISTFGSAAAPMISIKANVLNGSGDGIINSIIIYCAGIDTIEQNAFSNYNTATIESLVIYGPETADFRTVYGSWGLKLAAGLTIQQPNYKVLET